MILIFKRSWTFRSNSMQICGNCGILHPLGIREGLINRSPVLKIDVAWWWSLLRAAPQSFPPPKYDPWKLIFRCENPLQADLLATWWLDIFGCFFLEGWNVHPKNASVYSSNNSFEFHFVSLNIMVSQRTPAKHQIKYCKFILMTRPNQKKTNMYWFIPSQKKKQGQKLQKKTPWNPKNAADRTDLIWTPGCKSLILLMQISQSQWNIAQDIDLAYDTRMDIGEFDLLEILYWTLHGTKRSHLEKITVLPMLRTHQHLKRLLSASQWPYLYCYRKVRACLHHTRWDEVVLLSNP